MNSMVRRSPVSSRNARDSSTAFLSVMPLMMLSFSGSSSNTRRVSAPNCATSCSAVACPTPLRRPEAR